MTGALGYAVSRSSSAAPWSPIRRAPQEPGLTGPANHGNVTLPWS
jgi:hypothetical protein